MTQSTATNSNVNNEQEERSSKPASASVVAKLISTSRKDIQAAAKRLQSGSLVSFPTETVYGLGCHALDPTAVKKVFAAKERPLTDPLIVHVTDPNDALQLWDASSCSSISCEGLLLRALTKEFWPGPLTIVAKARTSSSSTTTNSNTPIVPSIIMANTGYVACRSPSHPIAQALIKESGIPIAAPSANKFGHVSPTRASHVMDDLHMEDVWIVDPTIPTTIDDSSSNSDAPSEEQGGTIVCDVGVESTVAKVEMTSNTSGKIIVLRHGAVSAQDLISCVSKYDDLMDKITVTTKEKSQKENKDMQSSSHNVEKKKEEEESDVGVLVNHVAPGQEVRHYSPNVQSYMISHETYTNLQSTTPTTRTWDETEQGLLQKAVILDFGKRLESTKSIALAYRDLCPNGDSNVAAANVFEALRWSELIEGAERVYFPEIIVIEDDNNDEDLEKRKEKDALLLALKDRLTRAASGVVIKTLI